MIDRDIWYREEKARFKVGDAFYNPQSKLVRDLGVLAAAVYRQERGSLRVLDALAGCGVRSLRYWQEVKQIISGLMKGIPILIL